MDASAGFDFGRQPRGPLPRGFAGATPLSRRDALAMAGIAGIGMSVSGCTKSPSRPVHQHALSIAPTNRLAEASWKLDWAGETVRVRTISPVRSIPTAPVVIALHGTPRNAEGMAGHWRPWAELLGLHMIVPEFDDQSFPGDAYSMGGRSMGEPGTRPVDTIALMFEQARARIGFRATQFGLFGHNAGAQLANRYLMVGNSNLVRSAVVAGADWHTMPADDIAWPHGLAGTGTDSDDLDDCWRTKVLLLVGEQRIQRDYRRWTPAARAEGDTRIERCQRFYDYARAVAGRRSVPLGWRFELLADFGHDSGNAVDRAAPFLA